VEIECCIFTDLIEDSCDTALAHVLDETVIITTPIVSAGLGFPSETCHVLDKIVLDY
jgi:hypothetical protein